MPIVKLDANFIKHHLQCPDGQQKIEYCLDLPSTYDGNIPTPIPVPTLVLMLRSSSFSHDDAYNDPYFNHEVLVHITPHVYRMNLGEMADYEDLFDPWILEIKPRWGYLNVLSRVVSVLVEQGKVPLEIVDYKGDLTEIYRRI